MAFTGMQSPVSIEQTRDDLLIQDRFKDLIGHAVMAPSGHNTQPWLFRFSEDSLDLFADRSRRLPVVDPDDRELTISCGAALDHMQVAAMNDGWKLNINTTPKPGSPDLLANIKFGHPQPPDRSDRSLFNAIGHRRTTRAKFDDVMIPVVAGKHCVEIASQLGLELVLVNDPGQLKEISNLIAAGDQIQFADPEFRKELSFWVRSVGSADRDGMSGRSFGMPDILSPAGAMAIRYFDLGKSVATSSRNKITTGQQTLAVLCSRRDDVADWLTVGRALSRILLALTTHGLTSSYLNSPIEVKSLRPQLAELASCSGVPQLLLRIGYGPVVPPSVRRSVDDVLLPGRRYQP